MPPCPAAGAKQNTVAVSRYNAVIVPTKLVTRYNEAPSTVTSSK